MAGTHEPRHSDGGGSPAGGENAAERNMDDPQPRPSPKGKGEPTMAQLFDPVAWERRLQEARARRAEALAGRGSGERSRPAPAPRAPRGGTGASPGASAGPALSSDSRAAPATGPAIAQPAGSSIRDIARASDDGQPVSDAKPAPRPDPEPRRGGPAAGSRVTPLPLTTRRPTIAAAALRRAHAEQPGADPDEPERQAENRPPSAPESGAPALPGHPGPQPAPGRTGRLEIPTVPDELDAAGPAPDARPVPALPPAPPRRAAARRSGWTRPRLVFVFVAGLALGLAGAVTLTEPVLERLDQLALLDSGPAPTPAGGGAAGSAGDETSAPLETSAAPDASSAAPAARAGASDADAVTTEAPPVPAEPAALGQGWDPAAPPGQPDPAAGRAAERPEVAALTPPPAAGDLPRPGQSADLPAPGTVEAPALLLPTVIPRPDAPAPVETARLPELPYALDAPALPGSPEPEAVAGTTGVEPPGVLAASRPRARPAGAAPEETSPEPALDLAALTPEPPDAAQADAAPADTTEANAAESEAAAADGAAAPGAPSPAAPDRVLVHVPSALSEAEAEGAIEALEAAGYPPASRIDVQIPIGSTNVRYYFPEDAAAARAMADAIAAETGQAAEARDFTGFRPRPAEGTVEIWLAGQPRPAPERVASPPPAAPPPVAAPVQPQVQPPAPVAIPRQPPRRSQAEAAMRDLEMLADEIARAIARSLNN